MTRTSLATDDDFRARLNRLTPREAHVRRELMRGNRVREVARQEHVSEAVVRTCVKVILAKLGLVSQLEAVMRARDARFE